MYHTARAELWEIGNVKGMPLFVGAKALLMIGLSNGIAQLS